MRSVIHDRSVSDTGRFDRAALEAAKGRPHWVAVFFVIRTLRSRARRVRRPQPGEPHFWPRRAQDWVVLVAATAGTAKWIAGELSTVDLAVLLPLMGAG